MLRTSHKERDGCRDQNFVRVARCNSGAKELMRKEPKVFEPKGQEVMTMPCTHKGIILLLLMHAALASGRGIQHRHVVSNVRARLPQQCTPWPECGEPHCEPWPGCATTETSHCMPWPECSCTVHCGDAVGEEPWPKCAETLVHVDLPSPYPYAICFNLTCEFPEAAIAAGLNNTEGCEEQQQNTEQIQTNSTAAVTSTTSTHSATTVILTTPTPSTAPHVPNSSNSTAANGTNATTLTPSKRKTLDIAEAAAIASTVSTVVGVVIAGVVTASVAGVIPPSPGAMAIIGQVQILSQIGQIGGGGGAIGELSDGFAWANGDGLFTLFPEGNGTRRRSSRRSKKVKPPPGETANEASEDCDRPGLTEDAVAECRQCGMIDGVPLMDRIFLVGVSIVIVYCLRALLQLVVTKCCKKDPWNALAFPNWEGPLLLTHWFGMCDSLTSTLGRPCPMWITLSCALLFCGPICFLLYAVWAIARNVKNGSMKYEEGEKITWKETRKKWNEAKNCGEKIKSIKEYYHRRRHKGEWSEDTKEGKFWSFLVKDFSTKAWKYCAWLLMRKLLLAAAMALTIGATNAGCVLLLQVFDVSVVVFMNPFSDNLFNVSETFGAMTNLISMIMVSMPTLFGEMPEALGDFMVICFALVGTVVAAVMAVATPILGIFGALIGAVVGICPSGISELGALAGSGAVMAAATSARDSLQEIVEDSVEEMADGQGGGDVDVEPAEGNAGVLGAAAVVVGGAAVGGAACYALKRDGVEGGEQLVGAADVTMILGLDFYAAGVDSSHNRQAFEYQLTQDLADATKVSSSRFHIKTLSPGSIVIDFQVLEDPNGDSPDASSIVRTLENQAEDPKSMLCKGSLTCYVKSIISNVKDAHLNDEHQFYVDAKQRIGIRSTDVALCGSVLACASGNAPPTRSLPALPAPACLPLEEVVPEIPEVFGPQETADVFEEKLSHSEEWTVSFAQRRRLLSVFSEWTSWLHVAKRRIQDRAAGLASRMHLAQFFGAWYSLSRSLRIQDLIETGNVVNRHLYRRLCQRLLQDVIGKWAKYALGYSSKSSNMRLQNNHHQLMALRDSAYKSRCAGLMRDSMTKWLFKTRRFGTDDVGTPSDNVCMPYFDKIYVSSPSPPAHVSWPDTGHFSHSTARTWAYDRKQETNVFSKRSVREHSASLTGHGEWVKQSDDCVLNQGSIDAEHQAAERKHLTDCGLCLDQSCSIRSHSPYSDHSNGYFRGLHSVEAKGKRCFSEAAGPVSSLTAYGSTGIEDNKNELIAHHFHSKSLMKLYSDYLGKVQNERSVGGYGANCHSNEGKVGKAHSQVKCAADSQTSMLTKFDVASGGSTESDKTTNTTTNLTQTEAVPDGIARAASSAHNVNGLVSDLIGAALIGPQFLEQKLLMLSRNGSCLSNLVAGLEEGAEGNGSVSTATSSENNISAHSGACEYV